MIAEFWARRAQFIGSRVMRASRRLHAAVVERHSSDDAAALPGPRTRCTESAAHGVDEAEQQVEQNSGNPWFRLKLQLIA
ncbi:hypothetical protein [Burkholderia sp. TSV86]|uniref:hypothetical protein n=1 Tax=Burkholderia sp. TSV86 TaxID=1385594 RepID=UPI0012E37EF0|nr:hypothetical protein [Burkholderia sp. TSV86]